MDLSALAVVTILATLAFEFVNGFHDSANSTATIIATRVLSPVYAVTMAAIFNFLGIAIGQQVAKTIGVGIIDQAVVQEAGVVLVFCAVLGAITWDLITWWFGIPTSSSHALVGGLLGAGVAAAGTSAIVWQGTLRTASFIVIAPMLGLIAGFGLVVLVMWTLRKVAREVVNKWFRKIQLGSSSFYSFTHGSNDAQKGVGIIALVMLLEAGSEAGAEFTVPPWAMVACALAMAIGTFFGGWRIVRTMASRITKLDPYQGSCAETGAALILYSTAHLGIPVSTTHTVSGSIMGVGATRSLSAVRWGVGRRIVIAWGLTIPASALIAGVLFLVSTLF